MTTEITNNVPVHVSMIMDGNGRWAKERGKERVHGHFEGVESVHACVQAAAKAGVRYLSIFAFSEENWNRPEAEVMTLMGLMVKAMASYIDGMCEQGVKFVVLGNRERLGAELNGIIDSCMERTAHNDRLTFIIFISYSGKWDILQAAKKMTLDLLYNPRRMEILENMTCTEYINREAALKMLEEHKEGKCDHYRRLWTILVFVTWYRLYVTDRGETCRRVLAGEL